MQFSGKNQHKTHAICTKTNRSIIKKLSKINKYSIYIIAKMWYFYVRERRLPNATKQTYGCCSIAFMNRNDDSFRIGSGSYDDLQRKDRR